MKKLFLGVLVGAILFFGVNGVKLFACASSASGQEFCSKQNCQQAFCIEEKFFKKAHFILGNQQDLELSDEQIEKIKTLKINVKKDLIMKDASIEVSELDIQSAFMKGEIDVNAINKLIDEKYNIKKDRAKLLVKSYADLKNILTKMQKDKMKEIWLSKESKGPKESKEKKCMMKNKRK